MPIDRRELLTIPNLLSIGRLLCVPLFLWLLLGRGERYAAAWLLAALGATDWLDGWVARRFDQVTELGKVLDPTADRILVAVAVVAIFVDGSLPPAVAVPILIREVLISIAVVGLAAAGARRIDVRWIGKAGTFALMVAVPLYLVAGSDASWAVPAEVAAWVFAIPGIVLGYVAAALYVPDARRALAEGRGEHGGGRG